jgi:hypothetical protein
MSKIKVVCGANYEEAEVVGMTVAQAKRALMESLNIPEDSQAIISGDNVNTDYILREGDTLEFIKPSGENG